MKISKYPSKFLLCFFVLHTLCSKAQDKPNILLFLVDDMGLMDTSLPFVTDAKGKAVSYPLNSYYKTPHMEALAETGIRFTNFYAHSVCSPSRATILTGQNSARHKTTTWINPLKNNRGAQGPTDWNWKGLHKKSVTLPRLLQQNGYTTVHIGKAHFGPFTSEGADPINLGFDVNIGGSAIGRPGSYLGTEGFGHIKGDKVRAVPGLEKYHGKDIFLTEAMTLEAKNEIDKAHKAGTPFFLHMSHYAVHAPFYSDPRFAATYKNSGKSKKVQAFATLIEGIDKSLGDLLAHLKEVGIAENTLLVFLGDNGSDAPLPIKKNYSSAAPFKGKKGNHWEGGMRVPFIASWAAVQSQNPLQKRLTITSNSIQTQIASIEDLFPTLCNISGTKIPKDYVLDGSDLEIQLLGKVNAKRKTSFLNHFPHGKHRSSYFTSLVSDGWKIIYHYPTKKPEQYELYDLEEDPFERENLAASNPEKLKEMLVLVQEELQEKKALYPEKERTQLLVEIPN